MYCKFNPPSFRGVELYFSYRGSWLILWTWQLFEVFYCPCWPDLCWFRVGIGFFHLIAIFLPYLQCDIQYIRWWMTAKTLNMYVFFFDSLHRLWKLFFWSASFFVLITMLLSYCIAKKVALVGGMVKCTRLANQHCFPTKICVTLFTEHQSGAAPVLLIKALRVVAALIATSFYVPLLNVSFKIFTRTFPLFCLPFNYNWL